MTTAIEYALMAGASYISNRPEINQLPIPSGWSKKMNPDSYFKNPDSGFEAISFTNGTNVVISFAGTDFSKGIPAAFFTSDFWSGNIPLITGNGGAQLMDALEYYLQVKASVPAGTTISLTGHSLGGALAALVGVFFGETAFTFDQVPAAATAMQTSAILLRDALLLRGHTATELAGLNNYIQSSAKNGDGALLRHPAMSLPQVRRRNEDAPQSASKTCRCTATRDTAWEQPSGLFFRR